MNEPEVIALEENEILEAMDYEAIQEKQYTYQLLEQKDRKTRPWITRRSRKSSMTS